MKTVYRFERNLPLPSRVSSIIPVTSIEILVRLLLNITCRYSPYSLCSCLLVLKPLTFLSSPAAVKWHVASTYKVPLARCRTTGAISQLLSSRIPLSDHSQPGTTTALPSPVVKHRATTQQTAMLPTITGTWRTRWSITLTPHERSPQILAAGRRTLGRSSHSHFRGNGRSLHRWAPR